MKKLFIIGNGFDLSHNLKTTYEDFHEYLRNNYSYKEDLFNIPELSILPDGSEKYDEDEVVTILIDLISQAEEIGEKWSDIETSLGFLDFGIYLDIYDDVYVDKEDDDGDSLWKSAYLYEDISADLNNCAVKIKELFSDWVNTIDIDNCALKHKFLDLINVEKDIFLTFNYTTVLEDIYYAKNVFHIHGIQGGYIIIGHGEERENFENKYIGSEHSLQQIHENLKKKTNEIIKTSIFFKMEFSDIDEIYSYGFSFSKVDMPYIEEICNKVNTKNVTWYLNDYGPDETRENYKKIIRKCGFLGEFKLFNV
ncbi:hypothetical protein NZ45_11700 [Clostridium botulinum]|uniref:Bacteriophage abortive infection AbiH family protein n=1 Tax=Clostridium botulinum TaxID=1491 RepID=A0ABD7CLN2_CLOBO|nr:bacteriophage abortive infection AbiH family protein [Clostridium botulinum]KGO13684.1 hypothetical protein NZ45_11700 [Clostridium botulinum]QRI54300.1 bacteriophage abortive infection AbiH family protein [Clostridium botulinum]